jgi:hypothetical protein
MTQDTVTVDDSDANLVALESRFIEAVANYDRVFAEELAEGLDAAALDEFDAAAELARQVCNLPASTMEGLRAKARVLAWVQRRASDPENPDLYDFAVSSMIKDLIE